MRLGNPNLAVDTNAELNGKWADCPDIWWVSKDKPMRVCIKGASTRQHTLLIQRLTKNLTPEQIEETALEINQDLALDLLCGWENHFDPEGNEIPFSTENAKYIVKDPDNRRYVEFILLLSRTLTTFDPEKKEATTKN